VAVAIPRNDKLGSRFGQLLAILQVRPKLWENRNDADRLAFVPFSLRAANRQPACWQIDVGPTQAKMFRGAPQAAKATQSEQQPPLGIRARIDDLLGDLTRDEVRSLAIGQHGQVLHFAKWIACDDPPFDRSSKQLPGAAALSPDGVIAQLVL